MSPIWVVHSPKCLHQIAKTSSGISETNRMLLDNLPRRHPPPQSGQRPADLHLSFSKLVVSASGATDQREEVLANSLPTDGILGLLSVLPLITDISSFGENEENSTGCSKDSITRSGYGQGASQICRESSSNSLGSLHGSPALQSLTIPDECGPSSPRPGC